MTLLLGLQAVIPGKIGELNCSRTEVVVAVVVPRNSLELPVHKRRNVFTVMFVCTSLFNYLTRTFV